MGRDKDKVLGYFDGFMSSDLTPEELDKEIKQLEEESEKLTEWPEM